MNSIGFSQSIYTEYVIEHIILLLFMRLTVVVLEGR